MISNTLYILVASCLMHGTLGAELGVAQTLEVQQTPQQELAILRQRLKLAQNALGNLACAQRQKNPTLAARDDTSAGA